MSQPPPKLEFKRYSKIRTCPVLFFSSILLNRKENPKKYAIDQATTTVCPGRHSQTANCHGRQNTHSVQTQPQVHNQCLSWQTKHPQHADIGTTSVCQGRHNIHSMQTKPHTPSVLGDKTH